MFDWVPALISSKQDDFWLNVLAGIPFLAFEVVIITLFLPFVLQWSDERRWRGTRLVALKHVLDRYEDIDESVSELLDVEGPEHSQVHMALKAHLARMDTALQTALPVLSPEMSHDILKFHYRWSAFVDRFKSEEFKVSPSGESVSRIIVLGGSVNDLILEYRALQIRYARDAFGLSLIQKFSSTPLERFCELVANIEREVLAKRGLEPEVGAGDFVHYARVHRRASLLRADKVTPIIFKGWLNRLRGRGSCALYVTSADQRSWMLQEDVELRAAISAHIARRFESRTAPADGPDTLVSSE